MNWKQPAGAGSSTSLKFDTPLRLHPNDKNPQSEHELRNSGAGETVAGCNPSCSKETTLLLMTLHRTHVKLGSICAVPGSHVKRPNA